MGGVRWKRIILPMYVAIFIYVLITVTLKLEFNSKDLWLYIFNLQGIKSIFRFLSISTIPGLGQMWFVTVIAGCYLLMVWLKNANNLEKWIEGHAVLSLLIAVILQIVCAYFRIQLSYFLQFFVGYFIAKKTGSQNEWVKNKRVMIVVTISAISLCGTRLLSKRYIDGTILYDDIVSLLSWNALSIFLVACLTIISEKAIALVNSKPCKILDLASYPLFLAHYMFLTGPMKVFNLISAKPMQLLVFCVATLVTGAVVTIATERKPLIRILKS